MSKTRLFSLLASAALVAGLMPAATVLVIAADGSTRQIPAAGTTSIRALPTGLDAVQQPEFREQAEAGTAARIELQVRDGGRFPPKPLKPPVVASSAVARSNPELARSFLGLNHRDQRLANNGNQFSLEPPDQALCVGNGFTVEAVNSVLRVFSSATGAPLTGVQDLNSFFKYPAAINRATFPAPNSIGPDVIDPVCHYDPDNHRFIVAITTLHVDKNGDANGKNTIDLAVSNSGDPRGAWTVYYVPAQNDGTNQTPNHHCTLDGTRHGPCFQDYPHIGADANGVYVSTNEYDLFGPAYNAAQVFAFSKAQLAAHPKSIRMTLVPNLHLGGAPAYTVWPATSPAGEYARTGKGTEYFLSSIAGDGFETGNPTGTARQIGVWALSNTASLNSRSPALSLASHLIDSPTYVFPPTSDQKPGKIPLADCINNTTTPTIFGPGCWQILFVDEPAHREVESKLDSNDTRMQQTWYSNGALWGALDTAVKVGGELKAGIAWFAVTPTLGAGKVNGKVSHRGYLALANNNLTYPAIALNTSGKGVIAFTVVGEDYYPSAGYATINSAGKVGPIHIAAAGRGPADGFTSYKAFVGDPPRTRWGDYGAAVTDGSNVWIASEYIAQTCSYARYYPNPPSTAGFGSCGATRTSLANWATRVSKLNP